MSNINLFTYKVAAEYYQKAAAMGANAQDIGDRRKLRKELQEEYGLTELEAVNALNGRNVKDIVMVAMERWKEKETDGEVALQQDESSR